MSNYKEKGFDVLASSIKNLEKTNTQIAAILNIFKDDLIDLRERVKQLEDSQK